MQARDLRRMRYDPNQRPFMVFWEVTRACDLVCQHCRAEAIPDRHPLELQGSEIDHLLDDLATVRPLLILTGGDCFRRDDLESIVDRAVARGIPVGISPSPTPRVTRARLERLYRLGVRVASLSIDGATPETHDAFRGFEGSFRTALRIWQWMREIGYKVQINTTVTRYNVHELPALAHMVMKRGAMTWSLFFLVQTGRGATLQDLTAQEYEDVMHWLYDVGHWISAKTTEGHQFKRIVIQRNLCAERGIDWRRILPVGPLYDRLRSEWQQRVGDSTPHERLIRPPMHLNSGYGIFFINHIGFVQPSGFLPLTCGTVRETPPLTIYRNHPTFQRLRQPASWPGQCGRCPFRDVCGGSRSRAYAAFGSPFADDPRCIYVATGTEAVDVETVAVKG